MLEKRYIFLSSNKLHMINTLIWLPEASNVKGIVQISHGMTEHIYRYKNFAAFLTKNGFIVCGNDHSGHGKSYKDLRGFMGEENGFIHMVNDLNHITSHMKSKYTGLPYILLGHSMGSFLARAYAVKFKNELSGTIFMGTKGSEPNLETGLTFTNLMIKLGHGKHTANILQDLSFKYYNSSIKPTRTKFDWVSSDSKAVDDFINDEQCNFVFTFYGFRDLFELLKLVSDEKWYMSYPKDLPTLITSGLDDPVGNYGKGVTEVYETLKKHGVQNLELKLYKNLRHEIINETNKFQVYNDLLNWIKKL